MLVDGCTEGCGVWVDDGERQQKLTTQPRRIDAEARFQDEVVESSPWYGFIKSLRRLMARSVF